MEISDLLEKRQHDYGEFSEGVACQAQMLKALRKQYALHHGVAMPDKAVVHFSFMLIKLARLAVSPEHLDSWKDIEGYAHLIHSAIMEKYDAQEK
jgi:hypothetical protein